MAGWGTPPKPQRSRARDTVQLVESVETGELHGPPLPDDVLPDGQAWHPQTVALWDALRRLPFLADEPAVGWAVLEDTAMLHHVMWTERAYKLAPEIRLRLSAFGSTPVDRLRLRVRVTRPAPPDQPEAPGVPNLSARRSRLTPDVP